MVSMSVHNNKWNSIKKDYMYVQFDDDGGGGDGGGGGSGDGGCAFQT